ncbi:hypothetical protein HSX37_16405|uniref:Uncharacterized protein n=1 Tax=Dendrosporobacter quercicolus TaxID=146817 RepID=A0A1G9ZVM4_9FIRM|nr:hypothetical protein [Dendrosporobacter quercicolus]NSL49619.1 hypothetical protein [Dendrosporobacter quercicolus DSM 1736]SDN25195.1 hypothetical protein SAMN04488502_11575 [Dendrosporobacter quercicolus]
MTIEQAALLLKAATEELIRHGAIGFRGDRSELEVHIHEHERLMQLPGELVVEERKNDEYYPYAGKKEFADIKFFCLYETDPRQQSEDERK